LLNICFDSCQGLGNPSEFCYFVLHGRWCWIASIKVFGISVSVDYFLGNGSRALI
jgi:hypothetical protein